MTFILRNKLHIPEIKNKGLVGNKPN